MKPGFSDCSVVHVVRQFAPNIGGLEDFVRNLAIQQLNRFASVKVVTLDRLFRDRDTRLPAREKIDGIDVVRIGFSGSSRYPLAPAVLGQLAEADLVHVHAVDFFFDALALSRLWHRKPLVATTHGGFFHTPRYRTIKSAWFNTLTRLSASQYRGIACCSQSDLNQFSRIAPKRVELIENGVNLDKFAGASSEARQKRLVTIGRFSDNKRLDRVLDVLGQLIAFHDPSWKLDIIGSESDLLKDDLHRLIAARQLDDAVVVRVGLTDQEVREALTRASYFVSASEYEGFGIALIEAMSAGLVPVVHPNTAFQELAEKHLEISLADFSRPSQVAETISRCWSSSAKDPDQRRKLMTAASGYGWPATAQRYEAFYVRSLGQ